MEKSVYQKPAVLLGLACLCTALWGSASPVIKLSYEIFQIAPADVFAKCLLAGVRFSLAGAFVLAFQTLQQRRLVVPPRREMPRLLGLGVVQTSLQYFLFYNGLAYTTGAKGSLFSSIGCFFVVLLSPLIVKGEKYRLSKLLGCVVGFAGLLLISVGGNLSEMAGFSLLGEGSVAASSLCFAMTCFYSKTLMNRMGAQTVTGWQMMLGGLVLVAVGLLGGGRVYFDGSLKAALLLLYLCLLSSVAYTVWGVLIQHNPVNRVSILQLLIPVFGAVFSALILKEQVFTLVNLAALALVSGGIWLVNREA